MHSVLSPIKLDDRFARWTREINDVVSDWMLPPKSIGKLGFREGAPKHPFRVRRVTA
jgi:hypothetical protein